MRRSFRPSELGRPLVRRYYPMAKGEKPGFQDLLECVPSHVLMGPLLEEAPSHSCSED
jgi:hypothetical protein